VSLSCSSLQASDSFTESCHTLFVDVFAAFGQLEAHVAKFGKHAFLLEQQQVQQQVVYPDMLLPEEDMRILYKELTMASTGLEPLTESTWKKYGLLLVAKSECFTVPTVGNGTRRVASISP
jgi:hypothetical protein